MDEDIILGTTYALSNNIQDNLNNSHVLSIEICIDIF